MSASDGLVLVTIVALAGCATPGAQPLDRLPSVASLADLQAVAFPEYESDRGIQWTATPEEYAAARADRRFVMEQFTYPSDGLTVGAYLYRPSQAPGRRLPVIIFNRGSFTRPNGFVGEMLVMANRYAQAGFIVGAPHYRGSNGWAGRAVFAALVGFCFLLTGFTNGQLVERNRYQLTPFGRSVAVLFTKTYSRILAPGLALVDPGLPDDIARRSPLATTWRALEHALDDFSRRSLIAA